MESRFFTMLLLFVCVYAGCKEKSSTESIKTEVIAFTKEGAVDIFQKDSLVQTIDVEFAETDYEIQTGLMYRQSMEDHQGMLFVFPDVAMHSFYMKNTEFPLDIIFIGEDQKIASFQKNAQPLNETGLSSKVPVKFVLEINAGLADQWHLVEGDSIAFGRN